MKVLVKHNDAESGGVTVEVIDPTDGAVSHTADLPLGGQVAVVATSAHSPADIEFGEVEAIPEVVDEPEDEPAPATDDESPGTADEQPAGETPEDPEDAGDGDGAAA